jgi:S-adenosylmethionine:tRNA ribosyltransferase-isomerase
VRADLFDYLLPADRIAQDPRPRGTGPLLVLDRASGAITHRQFGELPDLLRPGDLLIRNDVRVRHARLFGRDSRERIVEIFLLDDILEDGTRWLALARPGRRAKEGFAIHFEEGLRGQIERVHDDGKREVLFDRAIDEELLQRIGHVPLPPYIRREPAAPDRAGDRLAYQTVFAKEPLAVAAPTAGLHFTEEILERIRRRGVVIADLTLAVSAGTFKPVITEDTAAHFLDAEEVSLPAETLSLLRATRRAGGRIVAVGTTVTRALEAAARLPGGFESEEELRFSTDLFITPGFEFRAVDVLMTNFHLPRSTLLMLVSAFAGRENVLDAYESAIARDYLFYSYGDAMLIA